ncbi:MAG: hypothetical protein WBW67_19185, partial [Pseudolabrys sp.]
LIPSASNVGDNALPGTRPAAQTDVSSRSRSVGDCLAVFIEPTLADRGHHSPQMLVKRGLYVDTQMLCLG